MTFRKFLIFLCIVFFTTVFIGNQSTSVGAQNVSDDKLRELTDQISKYEAELQKARANANTLSNQIAQYDTQIRLTTLKISQTEEKISLLGGRIDQLATSLDALSKAFFERANQTYKMARVSQPYLFLLSSKDLPSMISSFHYLKKVQEEDKSLMTRLESAQNNYKEEKFDQEELQSQLESQKTTLDTQRFAKSRLLTLTKNDEKKYQDLLAAAKSEYEAIQAILSGHGQEEAAGSVTQGARIASIIQGPSCNSSGAHLHFIVSSGGVTQNPFNFLKPTDFENCSGSSCGSSDGDPFAPAGSWDWPILPRVKFSQGYGSTWAVRNTWVGNIYQFHNGIDIDSSNYEVRAVAAGSLFRGSYSGSSGCRLRYVRLDHDDSNLETFYLHINY